VGKTHGNGDAGILVNPRRWCYREQGFGWSNPQNRKDRDRSGIELGLQSN
jgi:catalase (peroxidase I)